MQSIIRMELYKLFHQKSIRSLLLIVFAVNVGVFYYTQAAQAIPISAYDQLQQELFQLPNEERYDFISAYHDKIEAFQILQQLQNLQVNPSQNQEMIEYLRQQYPDVEQRYGSAFLENNIYYTGSLDTEAAFLKEVQEEMDTLHDYPNRLAQIQEKANTIHSVSIFSDTASFSTRNIQKTAQDFQGMEVLQPIYQLEKGFHEIFTFPFTDFLILIVAMAIVSSLILEEKEKGLFPLLKTSKCGDWHTCFAKSIVMMLAIGGTTMLLCGSNLFSMSLLCNLGDLHAPLISLASFSLSTLRISIGQFLLVFIVTKWLAASAIGGMMLWISILAKQKASCFFAIFMVLGIELACYLFFQETGAFPLLKQINLITFLQTTSLYERYLNINLFSTLISLQLVAFSFLGSWLALCLAGSCISYQRHQDLSLHVTSSPVCFQRRIPCSTSLWIQEAYKLLWVQKGILVLFCFLFLQGMLYHDRTIITSQEEQNWIAYMHRIEGLNELEITSFIASQQDYFTQLEERLQRIDEQYQSKQITRSQRDEMMGPIEIQLYGKSTFEKFQERFAYVQEDAKRAIMIPFAYERLWLEESPSFALSILFLFLLLLCIADLFCIEYHHDVQHLLFTTRNGRYRQVSCKLLLAMIVSLLCLCIAFLPEVMLLYHSFGFPSLHASITSLPQFAHLPASLSILGMLLFVLLTRVISAGVLIALLFVFSCLWKTQRSVFCFLFLLLFVPLCLSMLGFPFLDAVSLKPLLCAPLYLQQQHYLPLCTSFLLSMTSMLYAFFYAHRRSLYPDGRISLLYRKQKKDEAS